MDHAAAPEPARRPKQPQEERIAEALRLVIDPELGCNIVDLGLVYDIAADDGGVVTIVITTTTRGCPATSYLRDGARDAAWSVPGVEFVDVRLTYEPPWTPAMIADAARDRSGTGLEWRMGANGLRHAAGGPAGPGPSHASATAPAKGERTMTAQRHRQPAPPPPSPHGEKPGAGTLLPMLVGGLALITIGMIVVAMTV